MKKLLALLLVLCLTGAANATVIDVVMDPTNAGTSTTGGADGSAGNPLQIGDTMAIKLVLNDNGFISNIVGPTYGAPFDGYVLSLIDLNMTVSSNGQLMKKGGFPGGPSSDTAFPISFVGFDVASDNYIDQMAALSLAGFGGGGGAEDLLWNIKIEALAGGVIDIDLGLNFGGQGESKNQYGDFVDNADTQGLGLTFAWKDFVAADLGGLQIHVVPEPMTLALLGLGSLGLLRRRRRA